MNKLLKSDLIGPSASLWSAPPPCRQHPRHRGTALSAHCEQGCPLNHRTAHRSYPQLWRVAGPSGQNRQLWPSDPAPSHELQRCKLPTVWITPVDNVPAPAPGDLSGVGDGQSCCDARRTAWGKPEYAVGNVLRRVVPKRHSLSGALNGRGWIRGATLLPSYFPLQTGPPPGIRGARRLRPVHATSNWAGTSSGTVRVPTGRGSVIGYWQRMEA